MRCKFIYFELLNYHNVCKFKIFDCAQQPTCSATTGPGKIIKIILFKQGSYRVLFLKFRDDTPCNGKKSAKNILICLNTEMAYIYLLPSVFSLLRIFIKITGTCTSTICFGTCDKDMTVDDEVVVVSRAELLDVNSFTMQYSLFMRFNTCTCWPLYSWTFSIVM